MKTKNKKTKKTKVKRTLAKKGKARGLIWAGAQQIMVRPTKPQEVYERKMILMASKVLNVSPFGINILGSSIYLNKLALSQKKEQYASNSKAVYLWAKRSQDNTDKAICECKIVDARGKDMCDWITGECSPASMKMGTLAGYQNHMAQTRAKNRAILEVFGVRIHEEMMINIQKLAQKKEVDKEDIKALESVGKVSAEEIQNEKSTRGKQEVTVQTSLIPSTKKIEELKGMLKGNTDKEKVADLKKRTSFVVSDFNITEKHAGILVASLLNSETRK